MKKNTFRFSNDDRQRLQDLLKEYDPKDVDRFIEETEESVELVKFTKEFEGPKERMKMITGIIWDLKFAIRDLENLKRNGSADLLLSPRGLRTLDPTPGKLIYPTMKLAGKAYEPLVELLKIVEGTLEVEKRKRGRPTANDDGLITLIASSYDRLIDIPRPYKGPFSEIISIVFNDDDVDRKRGVKDALKRESVSLMYRIRVWIREKFNKEQLRDLTPDEQRKLTSAITQWRKIKRNLP